MFLLLTKLLNKPEPESHLLTSSSSASQTGFKCGI